MCESCQIHKSIQQPFSSSHSETLGTLDLVHLDVWVVPLFSPSSFKFYVTFIDNFSRFTWLYPIANKFDVFNSFIRFRLLVEKQFAYPIKRLQTDNGGEYISSLFTRYLMENGILYRCTCPHTSQKNGTV